MNKEQPLTGYGTCWSCNSSSGRCCFSFIKQRPAEGKIITSCFGADPSPVSFFGPHAFTDYSLYMDKLIESNQRSVSVSAFFQCDSIKKDAKCHPYSLFFFFKETLLPNYPSPLILSLESLINVAVQFCNKRNFQKKKVHIWTYINSHFLILSILTYHISHIAWDLKILNFCGFTHLNQLF